MNCPEIIIEKINKEGPLSFYDFMDIALYNPVSGYYTTVNSPIGKKGDYYTSPYLTSLFGEMIGKQLEEMWILLGKQEFTIVEYGAGTGMLCYDILQYLSRNSILYKNIHYCIIEKSEVMKAKEKLIVPGIVDWYNSIDDIPNINGCILSNELIDNFPVHRVVMEEELMEIFVDYNNGFVEILQPASQLLKDYLAELHIKLSRGHRAEINLKATEWIIQVANALKKGYVLTIDYGYPTAELYASGKNTETLQCYYNHQVHDDPYQFIGEQDITTHVNFSALDHWGSKHGLSCCGFTNQGHFLCSLGLTEYVRQLEKNNKPIAKENGQNIFLAQTLLYDMGNKLKVLIQQKGVASMPLTGLQFSRSYI